MTSSTDLLKLRHATKAVESLVSYALDALSTTWADRLRPSFSSERSKIDQEATTTNYLDDFRSEAHAVIEQTEEIIRSVLVVAVYHVFEQHMIQFFYRWARSLLIGSAIEQFAQAMRAPLRLRQKRGGPAAVVPKRLIRLVKNQTPQLCDVTDSFNGVWCIDLKALSSWDNIEELRLVANCVKHGHGRACKDLRTIHPDWFSDPDCDDDSDDDQGVLPLGAFGLKIPDSYFDRAIKGVKEFLARLETKLQESQDDLARTGG